MEDVDLVTTGHNVFDGEVAMAVRYCIVRGIQCDHHGAHLCVNVAEDEGNPRFVELHKASRPTFIEPEIEAFSVEQRKHVVKKGVLIGKLNFSPGRNYQQRRVETL